MKKKCWQILFGVLIISYFFNPYIIKDSLYLNKELNEKEMMLSQTVFGDIACINYKKGSRYQSYLVNLKNNQKENSTSFIKEKSQDDFFRKVESLLLLKYPRKVVEALQEAEHEYLLYDTYLMIYFYNAPGLPEQKEYSLRADYNEIKDYLNIDVTLNPSYENESGYSYDPNKVSVAFTFDDGPSGDNTSQLIDIFENYKMSATFFMLGNKLKLYPEVVKKVSKSHSEIGYHSYDHVHKFTSLKPSELKEDFALANSLLNEITGQSFLLTRPPYGSYNKEVLKALDLVFITWNVDTEDWKYKDSRYVYNYTLNNIADGNIILFHDIHKTTVEAVKKLVEKLYFMDVQVLSVTQLAKLKDINMQKHQVYNAFK